MRQYQKSPESFFFLPPKGGLFNLAVRLMQLFSTSEKHRCAKEGEEDEFCQLSRLMGIYFQIRDDYANLCLEEYAENKSFAEDFTEGKYSFPIIHAVSAKEPRGERIRSILKQRTTDIEVKK